MKYLTLFFTIFFTYSIAYPQFDISKYIKLDTIISSGVKIDYKDIYPNDVKMKQEKATTRQQNISLALSVMSIVTIVLFKFIK